MSQDIIQQVKFRNIYRRYLNLSVFVYIRMKEFVATFQLLPIVELSKGTGLKLVFPSWLIRFFLALLFDLKEDRDHSPGEPI